MTLALTSLMFLQAVATPSGPAPAVGAELRGYPAGAIGAVRLDIPRSDGRWLFTATAGYNLTRRGDFGRHDDERGGGPGIGASVDRRFGNAAAGWFVGARMDWWRLEIDWADRLPSRRGRSRVVVFQPAARAGHGWSLWGGRGRLEGAVSLGVELNLSTRGEAVGDGAILLAGLSLLFPWSTDR